MRPFPRLAWLLLLLLPFAVAGTVDDLGLRAAIADDEDDGDDPGADGEDPFADETYEGETSFTKEQVEKAILKGVTWLRTHQLEDGSWGPIVGDRAYGGGPMQGSQYTHPAGSTALALYALLKCKVSMRDPAVRRGFEFLRKRHEKPGGSYETSMLLLAVCATANPFKQTRTSTERPDRLKLTGANRRWAQDLQEHLLEKRRQRGWRYQLTGQEDQAPPDGYHADLSSVQLAALALFAADQAGLKTPAAVWEDILAFSLDQQDEDGPKVTTKDPVNGAEIVRRARGFAYVRGAQHPEEGQATGSMTACGIANVMMSRFILTDAGRKREAWDLRPDARRVQEAVDDGLTWLAENYSPFANPRKASMNIYHVYWLYAVERAMDLVGNKTIGTHLWYSEMGQQLIDRQAEDGSWDSGSTHEPRQVLDTCFALLFLKKATQGQIPFPSVTGGSDQPPIDNR
jgi:hypothetical protein